MPKVKNVVIINNSPENINENENVIENVNETPLVKQKRGRKTKKQMEELKLK